MKTKLFKITLHPISIYEISHVGFEEDLKTRLGIEIEFFCDGELECQKDQERVNMYLLGNKEDQQKIEEELLDSFVLRESELVVL